MNHEDHQAVGLTEKAEAAEKAAKEAPQAQVRLSMTKLWAEIARRNAPEKLHDQS